MFTQTLVMPWCSSLHDEVLTKHQGSVYLIYFVHVCVLWDEKVLLDT